MSDWFGGGASLDAQIRERFLEVHKQASAGLCVSWRREGALGRLAEIVVLDQFSRNLYRDDARAFATDGMALVLAQEAMAAGDMAALPTPEHRMFLAMPYMHSESAVMQQESVDLSKSIKIDPNTEAAIHHQDIIRKFGRFPGRNKALGRESTPEEVEFLQQHPKGL